MTRVQWRLRGALPKRRIRVRCSFRHKAVMGRLLVVVIVIALIAFSVIGGWACAKWLSVRLENIWTVVAVTVFLILAWGVARYRESLSSNAAESTREDAIASIEGIAEWAKWMSGIQTAAIGGIAVLLTTRPHCPEGMARLASLMLGETPAGPCTAPGRFDAELFFALCAFAFLGLAVFLNAWLLSGVASIRLRMSDADREARSAGQNLPKDRCGVEFDVYLWPAFTWSPRYITLGLLMGFEHWAWAIGLFFFLGQCALHF